MAQFRVGQRVRCIRARYSGDLVPVGTEGTVNEPCVGGMYGVLFDNGADVYSNPDALTPILPPDDAADAFMARIKKLGSEPINDAPKVTERGGK